MKAGWLGKGAKNDLQWRHVYSQDGGEYSLELAYQTGESRSLTLEVNGQKIGTYSLNSGSYSKVAKKTVKVTLEAGENIVRLYNNSSWMPDVDYMKLTLVSKPAAVESATVRQNTNRAAYRLNGAKATAKTKGVVIQEGKKMKR